LRRVIEAGDDPVGVVGVGDEVQDGNEQDADGTGQVQRAGGRLEYSFRVAQVVVQVVGLALGCAGRR
jgi:hypothetical protein